MMYKSSISIIALALVMASCSSAGTGSASSRNSNVVTIAELAELDYLTGLEAVRRLRPNWLRVRGQSTFSRQGSAGIRLYVDGRPHDDISELGRIPATDILEMRFLNGREATTRYGTDHTNGAILVELKR
jgi:hypothetical protein